MAAPLQLGNLPDAIRSRYDGKDVNAVQMARELPRQYQKNAEDGQVLKFPTTKNILWDHATLGGAQTLHISYFRKPRLCIGEKVLRFAQRHVESSGEKTASCVLVGTLNIDDDGRGVLFNVERLDPAGNPNSSTSHAAGDMLIPFTIQSGSKDRGSSSEDYMNALQLLRERCCCKDPVDVGNFLLTKGWCSFYTTGDTSVHHLEFDVVTLATQINITPIGPVPIVPTALSKNLSGPMSISHMQGTPKTGYLTMDHTRKILLVLESDPKVVNLPLVGIWISGISYAHSPYVWACCLRYLHNSFIQDRVCSPPDPFLLVLYNPTHSKPEFYECSTSTGNNKMTFEFYTGYEAVQLSKMSMGNNETVELDLNPVREGSKHELFQKAVITHCEKNESRRSVSQDPVSSDDITPRLKPAPHKARMPMVQSMVPEVSLFFTDGEASYVPSVQYPPIRSTGLSLPNSQPPVPSSTTPLPSSAALFPPSASVPNVTNSSAQPPNRPLTVSAANYMNNASCKPTQNTNTGKTAHQQFVSSPVSAYPSESIPSSQATQAPVTVASHHGASVNPVHSAHQPGYHTTGPVSGPHGPGGVRPPYCSCPHCVKPHPSQFYGRSQSYEPMRGHAPYPRHAYTNCGPPPHRLPAPAYSGYPTMHHQGMYPPAGPGVVSHSYPPPSANDYQHPSNPAYPAQPAVHSSLDVNAYVPADPNRGSEPVPTSAPARSLPSVPISMQNSVPPSSYPNTVRPVPEQQTAPQVKTMSSTPAPQASGGLPLHAEVRGPASRPQQGHSVETVPLNGSDDVRRSHPGSDNSGRSSDDSGLSFTPEKHQSAAVISPKTSEARTGPGGDLQSSVPAAVNWENVPPEIYQLLMKQDQQLKQMQAQIEMLTAQSLNNTADSALTLKQDVSPKVQQCTTATNTSAGLGDRTEQVSACMQTSLQDSQTSNHFEAVDQYKQQLLNRVDMSSSSGSGCETRTPMEIRHRGRLPMNSTQREDRELDMSQGELVALMNNMHDRTMDSVQSEMIVDLPSFQSSPTRSPRSQESCNESAFNLSPRSPISASMCENEPQTSDTEQYTDEEDAENTAGTDNPEYYNRLMDNIKKLLSQNTTENTEPDGYCGDISSDPSTPVKLAKEDINLGHHLHSFFKLDNMSNMKTPTDTTFIPKINYVSMLLDSDTDTSMEINAMAMKYLKDEQLTQLTKLQAKNRLLNGNRKPSEKTALLQRILKAEDESTPNVTTVGMSPNDLTFATKRYLEKHGLMDGNDGGSSTSDNTQNDSYHLRTNYSTMTSGSEDDPGQITQEVLSTPVNRRSESVDTMTPVRQSDGQYSNRNTPGYDSTRTHSRQTYNDSRQNDSRQSIGSKGTPKPNHAQSRMEGGHHRFMISANNTQNSPLPAAHNNSIPYSQKASPFLQSSRQEVKDSHTGARYASPLVTPAPARHNHSPPERDQKQSKPSPAEHRHHNAYNEAERRSAPRQPAHADTGVPNYYSSSRQHREETNDDDRILDITRLKQLPKLL